MRKALLGCGAVSAALLLGVVVLVAWNFRSLAALVANVRAVFDEPEWADGLETPEDHLAYLRAHRRDVALVAWTAAPSGDPDASQPMVLHNADEPMPLASTVKIVVLAAYAREVAEGRLDPEETVPIGDWELWYLPGTDGGAHPGALGELGIAVDDEGFARDKKRQVQLEGIARAMIRHSDNAATDFLLERLGTKRIGELMAAAGLDAHGPIHCFAGTLLTWRNHETPVEDEERLDRLIQMDDQQYAAEVERLVGLWRNPDWRREELQWRRDAMTMSRVRYQMKASAHLVCQATAHSYARMLSAVAMDKFVSAEVSRIMRQQLEWPLELGDNKSRFVRLGTKGGSLPGVLTEAMYAQPRSAQGEGPTQVAVLFHRNMPLSACARLSDTFAQQAFLFRLVEDAAFADEVARAFEAR